MTENKRGNVWLAVSGLVINSEGQWLVVKKRYSGLEGKWSLPAGFVKRNETIDEAALREVKEETGIDAELVGLIGFRSGVIRNEVSDNMAIFLLKPKDENQLIQAQLKELYEAAWKTPGEISSSPLASVMLREMAEFVLDEGLQVIENIEPGEVFGYSSYKLFF